MYYYNMSAKRNESSRYPILAETTQHQDVPRLAMADAGQKKRGLDTAPAGNSHSSATVLAAVWATIDLTAHA